MTAAALLLAIIPWAGLFADFHAAVNVSDLSQASVRPAFTADRQAFDFETLPTIDVGLRWPQSELSFGYGVRLLRADAFEDDASTLVLHLGRARYSFTTEHHNLTLSWASTFGRGTGSTVALVAPPTGAAVTSDTATAPVAFTTHSAFAGYNYTLSRSRYSLSGFWTEGRQSLASRALASSPSISSAPTTSSTLPIGSTPTTGGLLSTQSVNSIFLGANAAQSYLWTRRWQSTLSASYGISGGANSSDQAVLAQQRTVIGAAALNHAYSRQDSLITTLSVTHSDISRGEASNELDHWIALAGEAWNRVWSRDVTTSLLGGAGVTSTLKVDQTRDTNPAFSAAANLRDVLLRRRGYTLNFLASLGLSPNINPINGELQTTLSGVSTLQLAGQHHLLAASADATQTIPNHARVLGLSFLASQDLSEFATLAARYRLIWQEQQVQGLGVSGPVLWTAALVLTLRAPSLEL